MLRIFKEVRYRDSISNFRSKARFAGLLRILTGFTLSITVVIVLVVAVLLILFTWRLFVGFPNHLFNHFHALSPVVWLQEKV